MIESEPLSREQMRRINNACDKFEEDLRSGKTPDLLDTMSSFASKSDSENAVLFVQLLKAQQWHVNESTELPSNKTLLERYPRYAGLISTAHDNSEFESSNSDDATSKNGQKSLKTISQLNGPHTKDKKFGDYILRAIIGSGGMGRVFLADQIAEPIKRQVALKVIDPERLQNVGHAREYASRFRDEARILSEVRNDNLVDFYETAAVQLRRTSGEIVDIPYISMEYVPGQDLGRWLSDNRSIEFRQASEFVLSATQGLGGMHDAGVIHKDIKPSNIVVPESGTAKLIDVGLTKYRKDENGLYETSGTKRYMSPEQQQAHKKVDMRSDIYSMGIVLFELLTRRHPLEKNGVSKLINPTSNAKIPNLARSVNRKIPRDLEAICDKCVANDIEKRYRNCDELTQDLEGFLEGKPISVRPVSIPARVWRWANRNQLSACLIVLSICLFCLALNLFYQERLSNRAAQASLTSAYTASLVAAESDPAIRALHGAYATQRTNSPILRGKLTELYRKLLVKTRPTVDFEKVRLSSTKVIDEIVFPMGKTRVVFSLDGENAVFFMSPSFSATGQIQVIGTTARSRPKKLNVEGWILAVAPTENPSEFLVVQYLDKDSHILKLDVNTFEFERLGALKHEQVTDIARCLDSNYLVSTPEKVSVYTKEFEHEFDLLSLEDGNLSFSVSDDGRKLAIAQKKFVAVWNLESRELIDSFSEGHFGLSWSSDGRRLVGITTRTRPIVVVRDVINRKDHRRFKSNALLLARVSFSQDSNFVDVVDCEGGLARLDVTVASSKVEAIDPHARIPRTGRLDQPGEPKGLDAFFDRSSNRLALLTKSPKDANGQFQLFLDFWEIPSATELEVESEIIPKAQPRQRFMPHIVKLNSKRQIVALVDQCFADGRIHLFSSQSGKLIGSIETHSIRPSDIAFSNSGDHFASVDHKGNLCVFEVSTSRLIFQKRAHSGFAYSVCFSPNDEFIVTTGSDGFVKTWTAQDGETFRNPVRVGAKNSGRTLHEVEGATKDQSSVITKSITPSAETEKPSLMMENFRSRMIKFSKDSSRVFVTGNRKGLAGLDVLSNQKIEFENEAFVDDFTISEFHRVLISIQEGSVSCYNLQSGKLNHSIGIDDCGMRNLAIAADQSVVAFTHSTDEIHVYDIRLNKKISTFRLSNKNGVAFMAFLGNAHTALVVDVTGTAEIWDTKSSKMICQFLYPIKQMSSAKNAESFVYHGDFDDETKTLIWCRLMSSNPRLITFRGANWDAAEILDNVERILGRTLEQYDLVPDDSVSKSKR